MKYFRFSAVFIFSLICMASYSQNDRVINEFMEKVEKQLKDIDSTARILDYRKSMSGRRIYISGIMGKNNKLFKQRIRYCRNGFRKETLKIYQGSIAGYVLVTCIIKINDKIHYVKHCETSRNKTYNVVMLSKEVLIDKKMYQKTIFNENGNKIKMKYVVGFSLNQ